MALVVTSFGQKGYYEYGQRFLEGYAAHWPKTIPLACYVEHSTVARPWVEFRRLFKVEAFEAFFRRHEHSAIAQGRGRMACWKPKDVRLAYSFRTDAFKFCRKVFALADAVEHLEDTPVIAWVDADVTTLKNLPPDFFEQMLGDADYAYLGREPLHSECGFMVFRAQAAREIIGEMARLYATDEVFDLKEWHDSYVFDRVRERIPLRGRSLTKPGSEGHVWCWSPLAEFFDHTKGERKKLGFSPERFEQ